MKIQFASRLATFLVLSLIVCKLDAQTLPDISHLQLWLDGSDPNGNATTPVNGTVITSWKDKSLNGRHTYPVATGSGYTAPSYYNNQINGHGVIRFNGSGLNGSGFGTPLDIRAFNNPDVTMFTVYKQGTRISNQAVWGCDDGGWDRFFFSTIVGTPDNGAVSTGVVAPQLLNVGGAGQQDVVRCLTAVFSKATGAGGSAIYLNGQLVNTFTDNTTLNTDAVAEMRIGLDGNDNYFTGDIAEMIVYNRKLSPCEITEVNRYLNTKYNVNFSAVTITAGSSTSIQDGQSVTLSTAATGTAYQWLKDDVEIPGATGTSYTATASGDYRVAVTNGCVDTSPAITVAVTVPPAPGNALNFDGVNDYVDAGTTILAPTIKTLECWARFSDVTTAQEIISKSRNSYGIEMLIFNDALAFYCMNGATASYITFPGGNFIVGRWYHLVATWDGSTKESMRLYVDGVAVGSRSDIGDINILGIADPGVGSKLMVGSWNDAAGRYFKGSIDEVRVWSETRTQAQIRAAAYDTIARNTTGLLAYLRFDHGTGGGTNTSFSKPKDYSASNLAVNAMNFNLTGGSSNYVESYATVAPMVTGATGITNTSFIANWSTPVTGTVNNYFLDVSTNNTFSTFVTGYNNLNVGAANTLVVSGLAPGITHYYRVRANKTSVAAQGANSYSFGTVVDFITLPVTYQSFAVNARAGKVLVDWSTASELNSSSFNIERSTDGQNFTSIVTVAAAGTTRLSNHYSYVDASPYDGINYYRIRANDRDGKTSYSTIRSASFARTSGSLKLYPSPATDHIYIDATALSQQKGNLDIFSVNGQRVLSYKVDGGVTKINITALSPGIYLAKFNSGAPIKFEKQ